VYPLRIFAAVYRGKNLLQSANIRGSYNNNNKQTFQKRSINRLTVTKARELHRNSLEQSGYQQLS